MGNRVNTVFYFIEKSLSLPAGILFGFEEGHYFLAL